VFRVIVFAQEGRRDGGPLVEEDVFEYGSCRCKGGRCLISRREAVARCFLGPRAKRPRERPSGLSADRQQKVILAAWRGKGGGRQPRGGASFFFYKKSVFAGKKRRKQ